MRRNKRNCLTKASAKVCANSWIHVCVFTYLADAEDVTKFAEMDMLVADLERANSRVAAVERRNVSSSFLLFGSDINPE